MGTGNSLKFTYEHIGFRKFSRGYTPGPPFIREAGRGRGGRTGDWEGGEVASGIGRRETGRDRREGGEEGRRARIPF